MTDSTAITVGSTRKFWVDSMLKIVLPVLENLAEDKLVETMPVRGKLPPEDRRQFTYLEAFGRTLAGIAPWLQCENLDPEEEALRDRTRDLALRCLDVAFNPACKDKMNVSVGFQPIVDAAFLAQGILRAPKALWEPLPDDAKKRLLDAMRATRTRKPHKNNWLLFSATIEALLHHAKQPDWDPMRIDFAITKHQDWYLGDGWHGDGPSFHLDYYNSFVIHPMSLDVLDEVKEEYAEWQNFLPEAQKRAARFATHQERLIAPDGTYPLVGRSLAYRFGAFHALAQVALRQQLEPQLKPQQVRTALTAVILRTMKNKAMFDGQGWLQIGVNGHQPELGENYISTGSLYLCSTVFCPLGLGKDNDFWSKPDIPWTMKQLWNENQ
ncbi:MAG: DUF2264 domain-containing protein [Lentisphaerae bacterium]|jgi:hypothetical protein|nr:DUF2264 domain-containing protein [Lentisphaerota bacterium]